jgi:hypothetical protein
LIRKSEVVLIKKTLPLKRIGAGGACIIQLGKPPALQGDSVGLTVPAVNKAKIIFNNIIPYPCRGRAREGVETKNAHNRNFYPHPNLPPARRKE